MRTLFRSRMDLSIIIPCYNEAENVSLLAETLFPVVEALAQTQTIEVVLIDDGSSDDPSPGWKRWRRNDRRCAWCVTSKIAAWAPRCARATPTHAVRYW